MSPEVVGLLGFIVLIALFLLRMWIGAAMAMVGFLGFAYIMGFKPALAMVSQIPFSTVAYYPLTVIPLFVLMGAFLFHARIGEDLFDVAYKWIGHWRGGLAMATTLTCAIYGSITGISAAAIVTMARTAVPEMRKRHYDERIAVGCIVCSGSLALIIPPSLSFIIYGLLTQQSVGKLFMAGVLPGIILTVLFMGTSAIISIVRPEAAPAGPKTGFKERIVVLKKVWFVAVLFLVMLGGIYAGIFTPTEGGAVGAFGAFILGVFSRRLSFKRLVKSLLETVETSAMIFLLIIGAYIFMKFLTVSTLTTWLTEFIVNLPLPRLGILAVIVILYIMLGMFLDIISAVILTIPIIYPAILALGLDPIWFGVLITLVIQMGLVTPPVGMDSFILAGSTGIPVSTVFRGAVPYLIALVVCIALLLAFPQIALILPNRM